MTCGGTRTHNANAHRVSEVRALTGRRWDDVAGVFHSLLRDHRDTATEPASDPQAAAEAHARLMLLQAITDPDSLPENFTHSRHRVTLTRTTVTAATAAPGDQLTGQPHLTITGVHPNADGSVVLTGHVAGGAPASVIVPADTALTVLRPAQACPECGQFAATSHTCTPTTGNNEVQALHQAWQNLSADPAADPAQVAAAQAAYYASLDTDTTPATVPAGLPDAHMDGTHLILPAPTTTAAPLPGTAALTDATTTLVDDTTPVPAVSLADRIDSTLTMKEHARQLRDTLDEAASSLAARLDTVHIQQVTDMTTGNQYLPVGGVHYSAWQHEALTDTLADKIATSTGDDPDTVRAAITDYTTYAAVDYYRSRALRDAGLKARDYATMTPQPRRLELRRTHHDHPAAPSYAADRIHAHRDTLTASITAAQQAADTLSMLPLDTALREYAALRNAHRTLTDTLTAAETDLGAALKDTDTPVTGTWGTATWVPSGGSERWDNDDLDRVLITHIAATRDLDPKATGRAIDAFRSYAHVGRYRVKALAGVVDVDDYRTKTPVSPKMKITAEIPEAATG